MPVDVALVDPGVPKRSDTLRLDLGDDARSDRVRDFDPERVRGVRVQLRSAPPSATPAWLAFFLRLSSTQIRRAAAAGDPLEGMLPADAAERIRARALYRAGRAAARLIDPSMPLY